ncbi:nucleotidyltransferase domain-containing protein [Kitasatospora sp. NPDC085879]|uniref:nucleotidyltransferase domain-containing protein n=1 Tax=Kitasatospora sp. NPDC085879 TaxID=3154769 RepID=UPI003444FD3B
MDPNDDLPAEPPIRELAAQLAAVDGIVGVCLGGSRARGTHRPDSDTDLGLYYRGTPDTGALRELAARTADGPVEVTEPGGWGPWVDGGAWLLIGGARVDWIYRDIDRVRHHAAEARAGRYETGVQPGHPLGFASHAYPGELALGRVLADPTGELTRLRAELAPYPPALGAALVAAARWEAPFTLANAAKAPHDIAYLHGCLFRVVGLLAHALHGRAGRWLVNEKGAVDAAGRLPGAPERFAERAHGLFRAGAAALAEAAALTAEVVAGGQPAARVT